MKPIKVRNLAMAVLFVLCVIFIFQSTASAEDAMKFYKKKILEIICPYNVGGGFDTYARSVAHYLPQYLPLRAAIVVNKTGGGGLIATNILYSAPKDGLTIGIINGGGMIFNQVMDTPGVKFDLAKFSWLVLLSAEAHVVAVGNKSPHQSIDAMKNAKKEVVFSATGKGSDDFLAAAVISDALGFPLRQVVGFGSTPETNLAAIKGDVDGTMSSVGAMINLIKAKDLNPILQVALKSDPRIPGVPLAIDVVPANKKAKMVAITNTFAVERPIVGPPGVPQDRVKALREALWKITQNKNFIQDMEKRGRPVRPLHGDKLEELATEGMAAATSIKQTLKDAVKK